MADKVDLYQSVTNRIIEALEAGTRPWAADWQRSGPAQRVGGEQYRGINQLLLSMSAGARGFVSPTWMTFRQAIELGGGVRKGERASHVVFFKMLERSEADSGGGDDAGKQRGIPMLRGYSVFNADQIDGLPDRFAPVAHDPLPAKDRDDIAEAAIRSSGATIYEGGDRACYVPALDLIHLPNFERFFSTGGFLATMAHEVVHWTGAPHRLDRTKGDKFGDRAYAFEELVAELGAAFVCGRLGIAGEHFDSHASYVASWLKALRDDKRMIFKAAALAQSACDMVLVNAERLDAPAIATPVAAPAQPAPAQFSFAL